MSKKNVNWTDEDEKTLRKLTKKKELYEQQLKQDIIAKQLFKTGKILKKYKYKDEDEFKEKEIEISVSDYTPGIDGNGYAFPFSKRYVEIKVIMPHSLFVSEEID